MRVGAAISNSEHPASIAWGEGGDVVGRLVRDGYLMLDAAAVAYRTGVAGLGDFCASYETLEADPAPGNRLRRYASCRWRSDLGQLTRLADTGYAQSSANNYQDGGRVREFAPMADEDFENPLIRQLLAFDLAFVSASGLLAQHESLSVGLHQIRYRAEGRMPSHSSPSWLHRDDEDLVFVHLFGLSADAIGGDTLIGESHRNLLAMLRLEKTLDTLIVTKKHMHAVSPVGSRTGAPAYRDILLVTFQPAD
ncbi:2OG-Fe dioxygenase family protein [Haliangium ochraceum]|uniref:Prolyl 4-hydroxylase alpha subunit Fe(2+) 2OG dioxygenase domain-containing protein n=1 Tax=Haliangium ochraceum (strain DSM 14365 / JCM 11303 / SMP-2) TaxID=502025 RepID=D0LTY3_HALO1|nr:2OG-Fe dioxygenase family protein [Haliangium ochraceum]ACY15827.1 Protein of unknown function DUF2257 [Haliangium ochraceum DSM 14365]